MKHDFCKDCIYCDIDCYDEIGQCYNGDKKKINKIETIENVETLEMIKLLMDNQKRKAYDPKENNGDYVMFSEGILRWFNKNNYCITTFSIGLKDDFCKAWTNIEPEPQKVDFVTAFKAYSNGKYIKSMNNVKYIFENMEWDSLETATNEEIDGLWIIHE
jgi:hypothetical protein